MGGPELKPCPFCGGEAVRQTLPSDEFGNDGGDVIECEKCLASSHVEFGRKENLVSAWNTRAPVEYAALPEVQALIAEAVAKEREADAKNRPTFPILNSGGARFDLQLVQCHGGQAQKNHHQSVSRLAERGGLSWCELHAVLHDRRYVQMDANTAIRECRSLEALYLAAIRKRGEGQP